MGYRPFTINPCLPHSTGWTVNTSALSHRRRRAHVQIAFHPLSSPSQLITSSPSDSLDTMDARGLRNQASPASTPLP